MGYQTTKHSFTQSYVKEYLGKAARVGLHSQIKPNIKPCLNRFLNIAIFTMIFADLLRSSRYVCL